MDRKTAPFAYCLALVALPCACASPASLHTTGRPLSTPPPRERPASLPPRATSADDLVRKLVEATRAEDEAALRALWITQDWVAEVCPGAFPQAGAESWRVRDQEIRTTATSLREAMQARGGCEVGEVTADRLRSQTVARGGACEQAYQEADRVEATLACGQGKTLRLRLDTVAVTRGLWAIRKAVAVGP